MYRVEEISAPLHRIALNSIAKVGIEFARIDRNDLNCLLPLVQSLLISSSSLQQTKVKHSIYTQHSGGEEQMGSYSNFICSLFLRRCPRKIGSWIWRKDRSNTGWMSECDCILVLLSLQKRMKNQTSAILIGRWKRGITGEWYRPPTISDHRHALERGEESPFALN